jgi:predicted secreted hydrolase
MRQVLEKQFERFLCALLFCGAMVGGTAWGDFRIPSAERVFEFPRDHGNHPDYRIEWWYLTGHLKDRHDGRRFGVQATFFRFGQDPREASEFEGSPAFGVDHTFLAHFAVVEPASGAYEHAERLHRDGWAAYSRENSLEVVNGDWSLVMTDVDTEAMRLRGGPPGVWVDLELIPQKPLVRFGVDGLSPKGPDPEAVSYYLSFTRLQTSGNLLWQGKDLEVEGVSWMDHEIASNQLSEDLVGWDWTAIHLDDGREIKAYRLRKAEGGVSPYSDFYWIDQEGQTTRLGADGFVWEDRAFWTSAKTGGVYPHTVRLRFEDPRTGAETYFDIIPLLDNQEITGSLGGIAYWEGACDVFDPTGKRVGKAYLELTGYSEPLGGE